MILILRILRKHEINEGPSGTQLLFRCGGPKGPNRDTCDQTTANLGTLVNWIYEQNVALWTDFLSNLTLKSETHSRSWGFGV